MNTTSKSKNPLVRILGNKKTQPIAIPLFTILCSLIAASIIILLIGKNPISAFRSILEGAGVLPRPNYSGGKGMITDFMDTLNAMTPMLFAALAVTVASKVGMFNIGVSGQMLLSGFVATVVIGYSPLPSLLAKPLVLLIGIAVGGLAGALIGWLKERFNINEVVSSIMLNYIFMYVVSFFIKSNYQDITTRQSVAIEPAASLTLNGFVVGSYKINIPLCFLLALLVSIFLWFFIGKTVKGFELQAVGANPKAARYAGIPVGRNMIFAMTMSGALAGLAGVTYYMGYFSSIQPQVLTTVGFDSIAVSLLGNSNPIAVIFSSFLVTVLSQGSTRLQSVEKIPQEIAALITGLLLLFSACNAYIKYRVEKSERKASERAALLKRKAAALKEGDNQ